MTVRGAAEGVDCETNSDRGAVARPANGLAAIFGLRPRFFGGGGTTSAGCGDGERFFGARNTAGSIGSGSEGFLGSFMGVSASARGAAIGATGSGIFGGRPLRRAGASGETGSVGGDEGSWSGTRTRVVLIGVSGVARNERSIGRSARVSMRGVGRREEGADESADRGVSALERADRGTRVFSFSRFCSSADMSSGGMEERLRGVEANDDDADEDGEETYETPRGVEAAEEEEDADIGSGGEAGSCIRSSGSPKRVLVGGFRRVSTSVRNEGRASGSIVRRSLSACSSV